MGGEASIPARPAKGSIHSIHSVGGAYEDHLPSSVQAIHEGQQRAHDAVVDLVLLAAAHLCRASP